jgi:hypothetical protein
MSQIVSRLSEATTARPGTKLVSRYSRPVEVEMTAGVKDFKVFRGFEPKQIVLNWAIESEGIIAMRITRKLDAWSENIDDGMIVFEESRPWTKSTFSDMNLDLSRVYYYTLFMQRADGAWVWDRRLRGKEFAVAHGYFEDLLSRKFPNVYPSVDGEA